MPPLRDCSEVFLAGADLPGWYLIDSTPGDGNGDKPMQVYCDSQGWTNIMIREHDSSAEVSTAEEKACLQ